MIPFRVAGAPEPVQVTGQTAGRAQDYVLGPGEVVDSADDFRLAYGHACFRVVKAVHFLVPIAIELLDALAVSRADFPTAERLGQEFESDAGIGHDRQTRVLKGVELRNVDVDELHFRILEGGLGGGGEVAVARADPDHQVGFPGNDVGGERAGHTNRPHILRMIVTERSFASLRFAHGNACLGGELGQRVVRFAVEDAAARDDEWFLARLDQLDGAIQQGAVWRRARDVPDPLLEQFDGILEGFRLNILRQGERHGAGFGLGREHAHHFGQRRDDLVGAIDPVPIPRDGLKGVIDRDVLRVGLLQLLEDGPDVAAGKMSPGMSSTGSAVDRGGRSAGHHVGRAGPDRADAGAGAHAVAHFGEGGRDVDGGLFVLRHVISELWDTAAAPGQAQQCSRDRRCQNSRQRRGAVCRPARPADGSGTGSPPATW